MHFHKPGEDGNNIVDMAQVCRGGSPGPVRGDGKHVDLPVEKGEWHGDIIRDACIPKLCQDGVIQLRVVRVEATTDAFATVDDGGEGTVEALLVLDDAVVRIKLGHVGLPPGPAERARIQQRMVGANNKTEAVNGYAIIDKAGIKFSNQVRC